MFTFNCDIVKVVDGDTLDVILDLGFDIKVKERVRLIGVNAPESYGPNASPEGAQAKTYTLEWVIYNQLAGRTFIYESVKYNSRDKYGRSLGVLKTVDSTIPSLNNSLITAGHATPYL